MTSYEWIQWIVVAIAVLASLAYWVRRLMPGLWMRLTGRSEPPPAAGCDAGCGSCNGCGTGPTRRESAQPRPGGHTRPIVFHPSDS